MEDYEWSKLTDSFWEENLTEIYEIGLDFDNEHLKR